MWWKANSYLVFDFETTGLNPLSDRIIQVGLCRVEQGIVTSRDVWLVKQGVQISPTAQEIHEISPADVQAHGVDPKESLQRLMVAMSSAPTSAGHNLFGFDIEFLRQECRRCGVVIPDCRGFIDTAALFKGLQLGKLPDANEIAESYAKRILAIRARGVKYSIPTCLSTLGIQVDMASAHDAGHDAYVTHLILQLLQKRMEPIREPRVS